MIDFPNGVIIMIAMKILKAINIGLSFLLELAMLAAFD